MLGEVIGIYSATNRDSGKPAENVQYAKGDDKDNWLTVDPVTAEIRLNKVPDRESPFVNNGTYYATILCLPNDVSSKTATGTIAINVADANDNCPTLTSNLEYICAHTQVVIVTATDNDAEPNGAPFLFSIVPQETTGLWGLEPRSDTSANLTPSESLWPGRYTVGLTIHDQQGTACPDTQRLDLNVCACDGDKICAAAGEGAANRAKPSRFKFAQPGIMVLILGVLLLLFVGVTLITCLCGEPATFTELPYNTREHLIAYHTEGQGEDMGVPPLSSLRLNTVARPFALMARNYTSNITLNTTTASYQLANSMRTGHKSKSLGNLKIARGTKETHQWAMAPFAKEDKKSCYEGIALSDTYLNEYYSQRAILHVASDLPFVYDYEGQGSSIGSVGCCSILDTDNDLQFLDDLPWKFKTLAVMCSPEPLSPPNPHETVPTHNAGQLKAEPKQAQHAAARAEVKESKPVNINKDIINHRKSTNLTRSSAVDPGYYNTSSTVNIADGNVTSSTVKHTDSSSSTYIRQQSAMYPAYLNASSAVQSARNTAAAPGLRAAGSMAVLPSTNQLVLVQQQPFFYSTTSIPVACFIQPQLHCNGLLLAKGPADCSLPGVALFNGHHQHMEYMEVYGSQRHEDITLAAGADHGYQCKASSMSTLPLATDFMGVRY